MSDLAPRAAGTVELVSPDLWALVAGRTAPGARVTNEDRFQVEDLSTEQIGAGSHRIGHQGLVE